MKHLAIAFLVVFAGPLRGQPTIPDQAPYQSYLEHIAKPLKALNEQQMKAVAGLVVAAQAGLSVDDYCPPLKQFSAEKWACQGGMISYAKAHAACKTGKPKDCPDLLQAEANWAACELNLAGARLERLQLVKDWPKPKPMPYVR